MKILEKLGFNKEERFALVVVMFFGLTLVSPYIWNTFDKSTQTFASDNKIEYVTASGVSANPSSSYVIKKFFDEINYYNYDEAKKYLLDRGSADNFFDIFKGLYYIEAINIEKGVVDGGLVKHKVFLNTIDEKGNSNKNFSGLENITVTLKKNKSNMWSIYKITY